MKELFNPIPACIEKTLLNISSEISATIVYAEKSEVTRSKLRTFALAIDFILTPVKHDGSYDPEDIRNLKLKVYASMYDYLVHKKCGMGQVQFNSSTNESTITVAGVVIYV